MITILLLISRPQWLDKIFATLEMTECNPEEINILGVVDGNQGLFIEARNKIMASRFHNRLCIIYIAKDRMKHFDMAHRRQRIANIHNFAKQHIKGTEYIWGLEDDSIFSVTALKQLQQQYLIYPYAGMISGAQIGRWGVNAIGGWTVDDVYSPKILSSIELQKGLTVSVDATGMYCFLTKAENYLNHEFAPYENTLGPDFNWGLTMRQSGLMNYIDFNIPVGHVTKDKELTLNNTKIDKAVFVKNENRWRQKTL